jgi:capsular exopolysaccharide synthesis family protein
MTSSNPPTSFPDYSQITQPDNESIDVKRYISLFISNWYWFAFSLFIFISLAYAINRYSERIYTISSSLLIKDDKINGGLQMAESFIPGSNIYNSQQNLQNEIGILKSFSLNSRVIESLQVFHITYVGIGRRNIVENRLYKYACPFEVFSDSLLYQPQGIKIYITILSKDKYSLKINGDYEIDTALKFRQKFINKGFNFIVNLRNAEQFTSDKKTSNKFYFYFESPENLANNYSRKLNIEPIDKDASLVQLSVSGPVAEQEADYLNKLMDFYLIQGIEFKNGIADSTIKFIDKQLKLISADLSIAEDKLRNFKNSNKLIDVSKEGALIQERLIQFGNEKINLELQQKYYEYLVNYLKSKNESGDIISPSIMGVTDQQLGTIVTELASLQRQKKQLAMNLSGNQAPVVLLEEGINNARSTLAENVKNSLDIVKNSISDVNKRISMVENEISKLSGTEINMINIQRTFDLNNTVYTFLLEKKAEAGIAKASNVSDNRIIDKAELFNTVLIKPRSKRDYLFAFIFGLFMPALLISLIYNLNNKVIDKEDIVKRTTVPIIGYISHNESNSEIPVNDRPKSVLTESFRSVRTSLRYFIKDTEHPVISITSTITSEGKTFISVNLATVYAMLGKKVLLIGLDLRKPRINKILNISNSDGEGMSEYLSGNCEFNKVIKKTLIENLYYAPSGLVPPNPAELIGGIIMKSFIEKARKEFDVIIIDTPPIALVSDALLITDCVDVNIFVVRQKYSSKNTLDLIQEYYGTKKMKNIGIIVNDINLSGYYGYGLRYGYSLGYGYTYGSSYYGYTNSKYGDSDKDHGYYNE